jgi:hypothetical protein
VQLNVADHEALGCAGAPNLILQPLVGKRPFRTLAIRTTRAAPEKIELHSLPQ